MKATKILKFCFLSVFQILFFVIFEYTAYAKIEINVERNYTVTDSNEMQVEEVHKVFNNTDNLYIPAGEEITFEILGFKNNDPNEKQILEKALKSLSLVRNGTSINFQHEFGPNKVIIKTNYPTNFYPGAQLTYTLRYKHPGLIYKNGALSEAYIHAFGTDFKFDLINTVYTFNTTLNVPKIYENNYLLIPDPNQVNPTATQLSFKFSQEKLINQFVYLQLGTKQIYDFELIQEVIPTENKHTGLKNRYELILPRNFKNTTVEQQIFISQLDPQPTYLRKDNEGNVIGAFDFYSDQRGEIKIRGYGELKLNNIDFKSQVGQFKDIPSQLVSRYTQPAQYWEVDDTQIIKTAQSIPAFNNNVYELTESMYKYVVDSIDYSQVKRFGLNERKGAVATLKGGAAVCMEYSDLFLTMMRARGVPARAAFGYGYDPQKGKDQQEAHQWVQVYMPGLEYPWVDVDVTWGEGGNTLIGGDLNHFYTHFAYIDPNTPTVISRNSFGDKLNEDLTPPRINIFSLEKIPEDIYLENIDKLLQKYSYTENNDLQYNLTQITSRYKAGFVGLVREPDLSNPSQLITLSTLFLFFVIFFYILTPLYSYRRKHT